MKKIFSTALSVAVLASYLAFPVHAATFCTDTVPAEYQVAAQAMHQEKVLRGNPDGSCQLTRGLNRAEFAAFELRYLYTDEDIKDVANMATGTFPDLTPGVWYEQIAKAAKHEGLLKGDSQTGHGRFGDGVNAAEAITITLRGAGIQIPAPKNGEVWYTPAMSIAKSAGVTMFDPNYAISRGDAVRMIYEVDQKVYEIENLAQNYSGGSTAVATPAPTAQATTQLPTPTTLKALTETLEGLSSAQVATAYKGLSQSDVQTLLLKGAFESLLHLVTCDTDINAVSYSGMSCTQTAQSWAQTIQYNGGDQNQATAYAMTQRDELLLYYSCGFDASASQKQTCAAYTEAKNRINTGNYNTNQAIINNLGGNTCTLGTAGCVPY